MLLNKQFSSGPKALRAFLTSSSSPSMIDFANLQQHVVLQLMKSLQKIYVCYLSVQRCSGKNCVSLQIKHFTEIPGLPVGSEFLLFHPVDPEASTSSGPGKFLRCNPTKPILHEEVLGGNFFFLKFSSWKIGAFFLENLVKQILNLQLFFSKKLLKCSQKI
jgi:hypothetical protein